MNIEKIDSGIWRVIGEHGLKLGVIIQWDKDYRLAKNRVPEGLQSFYWEQEYSVMISTKVLEEVFEFMKVLEELIKGELE